MNIDYISDLPWVWIWLGALAAFPIVFGGLLKYDKWQERRRVGRYVEPQIAQAAGVARVDTVGIKILPSYVLVGADEEQPTGSGAQTLASLVQTGSGITLPSGAGISPTVPSAKLSH